jgi:hypothetical protein
MEWALKSPYAIQNPPIRVNINHVARETPSIPWSVVRRY